jgi:predicted SprT family Zn-dependent metalloprotease
MIRPEKDMSQPAEQFVEWWVRYFQTEIPFKVKWDWKSESTETEGLCYRKTKEVRFKRSWVVQKLKHSKTGEIRNLIAHEMAHFLHEGKAHQSGKFKELKDKWHFIE